MWKNDYFTTCGHQPLYLQGICSQRGLTGDLYTGRQIVRACSKFAIRAIHTIHDICPDCRPPETPRM
jgi:hypothetical protein